MNDQQFLSRLAEELSALLDGPGYEGVYAGPWWETAMGESSGAGPVPKAWKCAVLRRRPEGGAEHWGHLFLISGPDSARATIVVAQLQGTHRARFGEPVSFPTGPAEAPFTIVARPIAAGRDRRIVDLARALALRLAPPAAGPTA